MMDNPWDNWFHQQKSKQAIEETEPVEEKARKLPTEKRPITEDEKKISESLRKCTFGVGSWDKKFVKSLEGLTEISEKQSYWIYKTSYRYRRQLRLTEAQAQEMLNIANGKVESQ
jgi:hypothetical protein